MRPWIGDNYGRSNELGLPSRLLVLGESHYGDAPDDRSFTENVVKAVLLGDRLRFFTNLKRAALASGDNCTDEVFWHSIAFFNYVLGMPNDSRMPPTSEMWKSARLSFRRRLHEPEPPPTHVIVCGYRLWDNLPGDEGFWMPPDDAEEQTVMELVPTRQLPRSHKQHELRGWLGRYRHASGTCVAMKIMHPSAGFRSSDWYRPLKYFFDLSHRPLHAG